MVIESSRERQKRIRAKIKAQAITRRVYVFPRRIVDGVLNYQEEQLLPTEVAAARALLDQGLKAKGF